MEKVRTNDRLKDICDDEDPMELTTKIKAKGTLAESSDARLVHSAKGVGGVHAFAIKGSWGYGTNISAGVDHELRVGGSVKDVGDATSQGLAKHVGRIYCLASPFP